uniref:Protein LNK2 n=1 Tax=Kalanchoe fedtschenkoi TaxID=63787 RepID=A0A7N0UCG2_KALFE
MLDWDDEELASILWGEIPETEDHIVPYPEGSEGSQSAAPHKKELNKESSSHELEIKRAPDKTGFHGWQNETNLAFNSNIAKSVSHLGTEPWSDPSSSTDVKTDHDSVGTDLAGSAGTTLDLPESGAGAAQFDQVSETSQNQLEEQENSDFVAYSWADIESFDDLDKIFSKDEPVFGNAGLGSVDELWSSSKDGGYSVENSFPPPIESLTSLPGSYEKVLMNNIVGIGYTHHNNQPISDFGNKTDSMSYDCPDVDIPSDEAAYTGGKARFKLKETIRDWTERAPILSSPNSSSSTLNKLSNKVNKQKKAKNRKGLDQKIKGKALLNSYSSQYLPGNQFQQFGKQEATSMMQSYPFSEPIQLRHGAAQLGSNHLYVPSTCENIHNQRPSTPMLSQLHCGLHQGFPGHEVSHSSSLMKTSHAPLKPLFMTPQEKIDKLRRRQQMQAMLAIKKQQQELSHQASGLNIDSTLSKKHSDDTQIEITDRTENDNEETPILPPSFDPSCSPKVFANKITKAVNDFPVEDSALSQLEDIISKLDGRVRLCIRDSLFRLATSAAQRHYPSDPASVINNAELAKDDISNPNRIVVMVDPERETNPIDRIVAHLLFHRPFDLIAKHSEIPKLSICNQPLPESKTDSLVGIGTECSKDSTGPKQSSPHKESESSFPGTEPQLGTELLDSSHMDVSKNASKNETQHSGTVNPKPPE